VEDENRNLLCTPAEIDKEDAVQRPTLGLREAVVAPDGTVSVSADLLMHVRQHWASPRRKLFVIPDGRRYISLTVSVDGAGLTKKAGERGLGDLAKTAELTLSCSPDWACPASLPRSAPRSFR